MATANPIPREERLRSEAALRGRASIAPLALSAWRGTSGRRYVVGIHDRRDVDPDALLESAVIRVERDKAGLAINRGVSAVTTIASARALIAGLPAGVVELHVHRLAEGDAERAAVADDLQP